VSVEQEGASDAGTNSMGSMRETFHLVLSVAALGVFLLAVVAAPRVGDAASSSSFAVLRVTPQQRRQQLLRTVETMYGSDRSPAVQQRQQLLRYDMSLLCLRKSLVHRPLIH
jgi:hypothetical protein